MLSEYVSRILQWVDSFAVQLIRWYFSHISQQQLRVVAVEDPTAVLQSIQDSSPQSVNATSMGVALQRALGAARDKLAETSAHGDDADDGGDDSLWTVSRWASSLNMDALLAEGLCERLGELTKGLTAAQRSAAELAFVRSLGQQNDAHCRSMVRLLLGRQLDALAAAVCTSAVKLVAEQDASAERDVLNGKFVQPELFMAELSSFNSGLQAVVGLPHPSLRMAMEREHTVRYAARTASVDR